MHAKYMHGKIKTALQTLQGALLIMAARGSTWEEVKVLLAIWGDEKVQKELDGPKRKKLSKNSRTWIQQRWEQRKIKIKT